MEDEDEDEEVCLRESASGRKRKRGSYIYGGRGAVWFVEGGVNRLRAEVEKVVGRGRKVFGGVRTTHFGVQPLYLVHRLARGEGECRTAKKNRGGRNDLSLGSSSRDHTLLRRGRAQGLANHWTRLFN